MTSISIEGVSRATLASASRPICRTGASGGGAWQAREGAELYEQRRGPQRGDRDLAALAVGADGDLPVEDQHRAGARLPLPHENRLCFEEEDLGGFDQK